MEENLATVKLNRIKQCINSIEKHYEGKEEDIELTFEFIIGSFFPEVLHNIEEKMTQNYIAGFNANSIETAISEGVKPSNIMGVAARLQHAAYQVQLSLNTLDACNRSLDDAGYFGWSGEAIRQENKNLEILENKTKDLLNYYKVITSEKDKKDAQKREEI